MRRHLVLLCILFVLILILSFFPIEGFQGSSFPHVPPIPADYQDRLNPLAASQNPLRNTAVPIGVNKEKARQLRNVHTSGLNAPTDVYYGKAQIVQADKTYDVLSPRIDDEESYLAKVKFCKQTFEKDSKTPFNNSEFRDNCGVCLSSGRLATGETFTTPTGVLVYKKDKDIFIKEKGARNWAFIHAIPSLNSATCEYATLGEDSRPVLPINQQDLDAYRKRMFCQEHKTLDDENECGLCLERTTNFTNGTLYSYVPKTMPRQTIRMMLYGSGKASLMVGEKEYTSTSNKNVLSETIAIQYDLGPVLEGTSIQLTISPGNNPTSFYVYGYIESITVIQDVARVSLDDFMSVITENSRQMYANFGEWIYDETSNVSMRPFLPGITATGGMQEEFTIVGTVPFTMPTVPQVGLNGSTVNLTENDLAAYDCPDGPYATLNSSLNHLNPDSCKNPPGQGPGNYTEDCLREIVLNGGCAVSGTWYKDPLEVVGSMNLDQFLTWIQKGSKSQTPADQMGCYGNKITTPCDDALYNGAKPSKDCLKFLYTNQSENTIVGTGYPFVTNKEYTSLVNNVTTFCQKGGKENPENATSSLFSLDSLDQVKRALSDLFSKATGNLDIHKEDSAGGRKTSWAKCFGVDIPIDIVTRVDVVPLDWHKPGIEVEAPYNSNWDDACMYGDCKEGARPEPYKSIVYDCPYLDRLGGGDYGHTFTDTFQGCAEVCVNDPKCKSFTWAKIDPHYGKKAGGCYPKSAVPPLVRTWNNSYGLQSGVKQGTCPLGGEKPDPYKTIVFDCPGTDRYNVGLQLSVTASPDFYGCAELCVNNPACKSFTWVPKDPWKTVKVGPACYLKDIVPPSKDQRVAPSPWDIATYGIFQSGVKQIGPAGPSMPPPGPSMPPPGPSMPFIGPSMPPAPPSGGEWTMFRANPERTGTLATTLATTGPVGPNVRVKWKFQTGKKLIHSSPAVADGVVYVVSKDGFLYAMNLDGTLKWKFPTEAGINSSPAIANGVVYVGSEDRNLYAIHLDGTLKWKFPTGIVGFSSPAVVNDVIYVGSGDYNLYAIHLDGTLKWKFPTGNDILSSPAVANGVVYVGSEDRNLYAINLDGTMKWKFPTGNRIISSPAVANGVVYVGSDDMNLYAFNLDGTLKWKFPTGSEIVSSPVVANAVIYVGSYDTNLYAINLDGTLKWKFRTGAEIFSSPAVANAVVYIGSYDTNLYAIHLDGTLKWKFPTGNWIRSSPAVANGVVYVGSWDKNLYAIEDDTSSAGPSMPFMPAAGPSMSLSPLSITILPSTSLNAGNYGGYITQPNSQTQYFYTAPPATLLVTSSLLVSGSQTGLTNYQPQIKTLVEGSIKIPQGVTVLLYTYYSSTTAYVGAPVLTMVGPDKYSINQNATPPPIANFITLPANANQSFNIQDLIKKGGYNQGLAVHKIAQVTVRATTSATQP